MDADSPLPGGRDKPAVVRRHRKFAFVLAALGLATETYAVASRGYGLGGNVIVRCREGHLFTTIWIPGVSVKSLRFAWTRLQHCPIGRHLSLVTPVPTYELTEEEQETARRHHDIRLP